MTKYYDDRDGQHQIYSEVIAPQQAAPLQNFTIRVDGLQPATQYEYRVCTQLVNWVQPYSASVGDVYEGDWYTFTTLDPNATEHHLVVVSDMHCRPDVLEQTLVALDYQSANHIIYAGAMMNNMTPLSKRVWNSLLTTRTSPSCEVRERPEEISPDSSVSTSLIVRANSTMLTDGVT